MPINERRYTSDNYYRRGQFNITFQLEPLDEELDEDARRRAVQQLLYSLRAETDLKISAFVDIFSLAPEDVDDADTREVQADIEDVADQSVTAEFVVYNKLGITSLSKLRRFMEEHLLSEVAPRIVLVDPKTGKKFRATDFTIQYLFHDFVAGDKRGADWIRLRELLQSDDNGYAELTRTAMLHHATSPLSYDALMGRNNWTLDISESHGSNIPVVFYVDGVNETQGVTFGAEVHLIPTSRKGEPVTWDVEDVVLTSFAPTDAVVEWISHNGTTNVDSLEEILQSDVVREMWLYLVEENPTLLDYPTESYERGHYDPKPDPWPGREKPWPLEWK